MIQGKIMEKPLGKPASDCKNGRFTMYLRPKRMLIRQAVSIYSYYLLADHSDSSLNRQER